MVSVILYRIGIPIPKVSGNSDFYTERDHIESRSTFSGVGGGTRALYLGRSPTRRSSGHSEGLFASRYLYCQTLR
jgi:hypothetical protein